ncbi:MAG: VapC toxin family PIN domain ribonuclease [Acidobacteria bacterium]|nr:VapC toxin family PIN domain ribonuclease [Acidobacteriota bacterium]
MALLDVNVLVALFAPDHVHHEPAHRWFVEHRAFGWATCPLTENGLVRVLGHPVYSRAAGQAVPLLEHLQAFCGSGGHSFWPDDISLRDADLFALGAVPSHRQVTDLYLLGLAVKRGGCLATFDRHIPITKVRGAGPGSLALIPA